MFQSSATVILVKAALQGDDNVFVARITGNGSTVNSQQSSTGNWNDLTITGDNNIVSVFESGTAGGNAILAKLGSSGTLTVNVTGDTNIAVININVP